jgi:site-specific DNA-methyltransferase (adenine-specific)
VPRRCLRLHGGSGTVLDPFLGSGTTLVAAKELGWRGIGIEVNPTDVEIARRRIAAAQEGP